MENNIEPRDNFYADEMNYERMENKLKKEYVGKFIWDKENKEFDEIVDVYVDYREEAQHMNRVVTEYGNHYFISELLNYVDLEKEIFKV